MYSFRAKTYESFSSGLTPRVVNEIRFGAFKIISVLNEVPRFSGRVVM